jgi:protein-S-isoprenylcysteine O-methyltransferase Ste14
MTDTDTPNVVIFPPLIPLSVLVAGVVLNFLIPLGLLAHVFLLGRIAVGAIAFVAGVGMVIGANRIFQRIGTNTRPSLPTLALGTTGIFTWTRNPMYVGGSLALLGIAIGFALDWVILLLVASLPLIHYGIILREERYLERKFGDEYRRYKKRVPRYWWRF